MEKYIFSISLVLEICQICKLGTLCCQLSRALSVFSIFFTKYATYSIYGVHNFTPKFVNFCMWVQTHGQKMQKWHNKIVVSFDYSVEKTLPIYTAGCADKEIYEDGDRFGK